MKITRNGPARMGTRLLALVLALTLSACGGGGGNPGAVGSTGSTGNTGGTGSTGTTGNTSTPTPAVTLALVDGSGGAVSSLSGGQSATVKATVKGADGKPAANAIVQFSATTSGMVAFTPASGSALTDANGLAVVTVKPASISAAGAVGIVATSAVAGVTATATTNIAVGAAPLTVGTLAFSPAPSGSLPAFSTLSLNIPITSGGAPADSAPGLTMTSLCVGDGTATLVPGTLANGVQVATYTNNGCLRGNDTITVSIGSSVQTIGVAVSSANIGAIQFSGTNMSGTSIVLKGSGGQGRSESAQVTFKVVDEHNNALPGVDVNFSATTYTGGLTVSPTRATTDASGSVSTMVSSGTIPTPVRVIAEATRNGVTISGLSDTLTISTGLPIQRSMSLSADKYNIEGADFDGTEAKLTIRLADQYGNPVSDNTAVNFVTEGGAVGSSSQGGCTTTNGGCTVSLISQEFRPTNGRVTVLAYLQGIEDFVDSNGDGQYSCTNFVDASGNVPTTYRPLVDTCLSGGEPFTDLGDAFLDTGSHASTSGVSQAGTLDGAYEPANGDLPFPYGHTTYSSAGDGKWGLNYIRRSVEIVFSGSTATLIRQVCSNGSCRDWTAADGDASVLTGVAGTGCSAQQLTFRLIDRNNNPMPAGSTLTGSADKLSLDTIDPSAVPSTNLVGGTFHSVIVKPDSQCASGSVTLRVTTPKGTTTAFMFKST
jgi:hypothetical protein